MLLGLDNSRARGRPKQPLTRVAFYSSYWIDNRTGMDLMFQDHAAAQANPFLLGARMPGAYAEVLVPGARPAGVSTQLSQWLTVFTQLLTPHMCLWSPCNCASCKQARMHAWDGVWTQFVLAAALPRAVTERGILETWDVQSAEEIPVASVLLNTQVRTTSVPHCSPCGVWMQLKSVTHEAKGCPLHSPCLHFRMAAVWCALLPHLTLQSLADKGSPLAH